MHNEIQQNTYMINHPVHTKVNSVGLDVAVQLIGHDSQDAVGALVHMSPQGGNSYSITAS